MDEILSNKEIFQNIVAALKISVRQFALRMGQSYNRIFDIYSGRTAVVAPDIVAAIRDTYGVNEMYITLGIGDMFTDPNKKIQIHRVKSISKSREDEDDVVNALTKMVARLSYQMKEKDAYIHELEELLKANNIAF